MLKRLGLYSAALFATLALMQLPAASAQNRDGGGRNDYNTRQTSNNYRRPVVQGHADSRDNESHMMPSNRDHERNTRYRHSDDDQRWERR